MKSVLIVAFRFPPSAVSGTFRSLGFVRHLANRGWEQQVLTINESLNESPDATLLAKLPDNVSVIRSGVMDPFQVWARSKAKFKKGGAGFPGKPETKPVPTEVGTKNHSSFKDTLTHFLKTPDNQIGWFFPALFKFFKLSKPDLIYSSAPPFTSHLIAVAFKKIWRVPLVCDFRDPWLDNPFRTIRPGWVEKWEQKLENRVIQYADIIIVNTQPVAAAMAARHPEAHSRIHVITNGYDPEDFSNINPFRDIEEAKFLLLHAGSLYGQRDPREFLKGLHSSIYENGCKNIKVQLIGPAQGYSGMSLAEHVKELQLEEYVDLIDSIPHQEALQRMKGADMLLLFSQGTNLQVPAKIYEYMGLGKGIFAINEPDSATTHIMEGFGKRHFACENCAAQIADKLTQAYNLWSDQPAEIDSINGNTKQYLRKELTNKLEKIMLSVLEKKV